MSCRRTEHKIKVNPLVKKRVPTGAGQRFHTHLGLIGFDQDFADLEVQHLVVPPTGQHVVAHAGQRVAHEEISITHNQSLRHLDRGKNKKYA